MKIAVMTSWNDETGAAVHAKALVKAWLDMGHKVTVFSFLREELGGEDKFTGKDERYVIRCFEKNFLDLRPILATEFDIIVVENLRSLPVEQLARIFHMIKNRARTVHVVHEDKLPEGTWFYQLPWDKVIYFDKRQDFLRDAYPDTEYIPFPCFPIRRGNKNEIPQQSEYFQPLKDEAVYYKDTEDLCHKLVAFCEDEEIAKGMFERSVLNFKQKHA